MVKKQPQQQPSSSQPQNHQYYQVFISGLPYETTQQQLQKFLGGSQGLIHIKMPRYQDTNRCRGYAHVKFHTEAAYNSALAKDKQNLGNRYLTVQPAKGQKQSTPAPTIPVGCKSLFIKGLPYQITEQQLKQQFMSCGKVTDVRMVRNSMNRKFKGFAYVDFKQPSSLKKAITKYHNQLYQGRKLICDASLTNMKKGYKRRDQKEEEGENGNQNEE